VGTDDVATPRHAAPPSARRALARQALSAGRHVVSDHRLFAILVVLAAALRAVVQLAYQPALLFSDSAGYLYNAEYLVPLPLRPAGYAFFLKPLVAVHNLAVIAVAQHVLGLALGVAIYVLLVRLRLRPWVAALAAVPVLFDGFQLDIEQYVMSDTLFEAVLLAAVVLLAWPRERLGHWRIAGAGLLLAIGAIVRFDGVILVVPALLFVFVARRPVAAKATGVGVLLAAFAAPLLLYASWFHSQNGEFSIAGSSGRFLYGHVAPIADCSSLDLPPDEQSLCPAEPIGQRHNVNWYVWDPHSPANASPPLAGKPSDDLLRDFALRVVKQQPVDYAETVVADFLKGFRPTHTTTSVDDIGSEPWDFGTDLPSSGVDPQSFVTLYGGAEPHVVHSLATFLAGYQNLVYAPGPLLAACLLAGIVALCWPRVRRSPLWPATLLFVTAGVLVVLPADAVSLFSWRYQLPQLLLLPPAAALGVTAIRRAVVRKHAPCEMITLRGRRCDVQGDCPARRR
jgi:hypothetical protein